MLRDVSRRRWRNRLLIAAATVLLATAPASAQRRSDDAEKLPPYDVDGLEHRKQWVPWVAAFLLAGAVVAIAFKNPHRSHLD